MVYFLSGLFLICQVARGGDWDVHGRLQVSEENPHYLAYSDGEPFFWLADTAWELFHRLDRDEAVQYLENRAQKEFSVIQAVVLSEFGGLTVPNAYGDLVLADADPLRPIVTRGNDSADPVAYDYFDHVEYVVEQAARLNLYIGMLPCWGEYVVPREGHGIFDTRKQAYGYGYFIGDRFKGHPNIIWILGGDRQPDERPGAVDLWRAMAEGIADGGNGKRGLDGEADYSTTLMTHHSFSSSSNWFHEDPWIDLHTWGSYHSDFYISRAYSEAESDWGLADPKPTLNSEPAYEDHAINWLEDNGYFMAYDVRQIAYWSVFAGAAGHTYGAHPVWQFFDKGREPISFARTPWREAIDFAGARQMTILKRLMLSRPMLELVPAQSMIAGGQGEGAGHIRAIRGKNFAFIYIPTGAVTTVRMGQISGEKVTASWLNPRTGEVARIGEFANVGTQTFDPPGLSETLSWLQTGRGCDWVLVLDDAAAGFQKPR